MKRIATAILAILAAAGASVAADNMPVNGEVWYDTGNNPINAHGGGIIRHDGKYYWYGEYKGDETYRSPNVGWECYRTDFTGVSCYSSPDLATWTFEGIVLSPDKIDPSSEIHPTMVVERPKVLYNDNTGKFVMWMHIDNFNYSYARAGVAVSDSPAGPFTFIESTRPDNSECRDLTIYKDLDGKAYLIYSSEGNSTLHISRLTDDYLKVSGDYTRNFAGDFREAPAVFHHDGKYYIVSSGCTGWSPNEAAYGVADSIMGPYTLLPNPCTGIDADKTFYCQSTFALPVEGKGYLLMFDRWKKEQLDDSRYVWLPVNISDNGITIPWAEKAF